VAKLSANNVYRTQKMQFATSNLEKFDKLDTENSQIKWAIDRNNRKSRCRLNSVEESKIIFIFYIIFTGIALKRIST